MNAVKTSFKIISLFLFCMLVSQGLFSETRGVKSGERYDRLIIRNVFVIDGNGTPPSGPMDIVIEGNKISSVRSANRDEKAYEGEQHVLDGTGMYLLPGLINIHAHIQDSRGGLPMPFEYSYKVWLSCGITSIRDVGSDLSKTIEERRKSQEGLIAAPRLFLYMRAGGNTPEEARQSVREIKKRGGDGIKMGGRNRDIMEATLDEAHKLGLRSAIHVGLAETDAWECAEFGVTSIEHAYGIPDAALHGSQNFPYWFVSSNENDRFRYHNGRSWHEADPEKLKKVLKTLAEKDVAWCPTFVIYEANRDLLRAMNQPWFKDYLHPTLGEYFKPRPGKHGSYFWNWTTTDEVFFKRSYKLWMAAVQDFARMGGVVGVGEDAGFIYMMYGFSLIRELELHQEAGFHPIDVIKHATGNNAKILGMEDKLGRVRQGYLADIILIDENPLENLKYLYPTGVLEVEDEDWQSISQGKYKLINKGGVKWTIKDGFVYHAPTLLEDVGKMVSQAKK